MIIMIIFNFVMVIKSNNFLSTTFEENDFKKRYWYICHLQLGKLEIIVIYLICKQIYMDNIVRLKYTIVTWAYYNNRIIYINILYV